MIIAKGVITVVKGKQMAVLECDNTDDVATLETYAEENELAMGSECFCIDTSEVYKMKSDGTWKVVQ